MGSSNSSSATLVGRDGDLGALLRALRSLLDDGAPAYVTVTGLPGVGRSTLAAAAAAQLSDTAVVTVQLAGAHDPLSAADAVLAQLPGDVLSTSLPEAMWESYDGAPVLVVLEDVDRVEGLPGLVAELRDRYPAAVVLCTALRPAYGARERVVRLTPLPLPEDEAGPDHPALALFASRASSYGVELDLGSARTRAAVARICREAGGLPGVIELAAARAGTVPPAVMARALAGRHGLSGLHPVGDRAGDSLEAALAWSHDLLSKAAQRMLEQVSVFEGPFLLDAVNAVVDRGPTSGDPADDLLELVDAHLVELDPVGEGEPRFVVPTLVRGFARNLLDAGEAADAVRDRHAGYFRNRGRSGADVVRREWRDIAAALDHETAHGRVDDALASAVALAPDVQEMPGAAAALQDKIIELLDRNEPVPDELRARALMWSSTTFPGGAAADMQRVGLWTARRLAEATNLARESGDGPALLEALERTVRSLRITLDLASAVAAAHEGLELARRLDDQRALARFECWVAMALRTAGDAEAAARLAASAVVRGREHGDEVAIITGAHHLLAMPEQLRPRIDPPLPDLESLLERCERAELPFVAMVVLGALARESLVRGDPPAAANWVCRALMIAANRQRSEPMATLGCVTLLVSIALALGQREEAARLRESTRPLEVFVPYTISPEAFMDYQRDVVALEASVPEERRKDLAAEVATLSVEQTNRWAQEVARRLAGHQPPGPVPDDRSTSPEALTAREREVLAGLASGRTNREIADQLGMSAKTVMHHSVAIYRKLGVRGRAAATAWAYEHGVTSMTH